MGDRARAVGEGLRKQVAALHHNGRLLLLFSLINGFTLMSVGALVNPYLRGMGMSAAFIGTYFAISSIAQAVASFGGGFLADAIGRRRIWLIGKALQALSYLVLASGVGEPWVMVAAVLSGLSQIGSGAFSALTAEATGDASRATFFSVVRTIDSAVGTVAPLAGGFVADAWGAPTAFRLALPLFGLVALTISRMHESPRQVPSGVVPGARPAAVGVRLRGFGRRIGDGVLRGPFPRTALALMGYNMVNGIGNGLIMLALPLILKDRFGLGYAGVSAAQTAISLGSAMVMIVGGRLADKRGRRLVMLSSSTSMSLSFMLLPLARSVWQFYALLFAVPLLGNAANGAFGATQMECVRPETRATFGGVCGGLNALGFAVGSVAGGVLYGLQPGLPITAAIVSNLAGCAVLWLFLEETGRRAQPVAAPVVATEPVKDAAP